MARLTDSQRIKRQADKVAQEQARLAALQRRVNARVRKSDTHRKIIMGGMVMAAMEKDATFAEQITVMARRKLTRTQDRAAFPEWFPAQPADGSAPPKDSESMRS